MAAPVIQCKLKAKDVFHEAQMLAIDWVDVLDDYVFKFVKAHAVALNSSVEVVLFPLLSSVAGWMSSGDSEATVQLTNWSENICVWSVVFARSGERKSSALEKIVIANNKMKGRFFRTKDYNNIITINKDKRVDICCSRYEPLLPKAQIKSWADDKKELYACPVRVMFVDDYKMNRHSFDDRLRELDIYEMKLSYDVQIPGGKKAKNGVKSTNLSALAQSLNLSSVLEHCGISFLTRCLFVCAPPVGPIVLNKADKTCPPDIEAVLVVVKDLHKSCSKYTLTDDAMTELQSFIDYISSVKKIIDTGPTNDIMYGAVNSSIGHVIRLSAILTALNTGITTSAAMLEMYKTPKLKLIEQRTVRNAVCIVNKLLGQKMCIFGVPLSSSFPAPTTVQPVSIPPMITSPTPLSTSHHPVYDYVVDVTSTPCTTGNDDMIDNETSGSAITPNTSSSHCDPRITTEPTEMVQTHLMDYKTKQESSPMENITTNANKTILQNLASNICQRARVKLKRKIISVDPTLSTANPKIITVVPSRPETISVTVDPTVSTIKPKTITVTEKPVCNLVTVSRATIGQGTFVVECPSEQLNLGYTSSTTVDSNVNASERDIVETAISNQEQTTDSSPFSDIGDMIMQPEVVPKQEPEWSQTDDVPIESGISQHASSSTHGEMSHWYSTAHEHGTPGNEASVVATEGVNTDGRKDSNQTTNKLPNACELRSLYGGRMIGGTRAIGGTRGGGDNLNIPNLYAETSNDDFIFQCAPKIRKLLMSQGLSILPSFACQYRLFPPVRHYQRLESSPHTSHPSWAAMQFFDRLQALELGMIVGERGHPLKFRKFNLDEMSESAKDILRRINLSESEFASSYITI